MSSASVASAMSGSGLGKFQSVINVPKVKMGPDPTSDSFSFGIAGISVDEFTADIRILFVATDLWSGPGQAGNTGGGGARAGSSTLERVTPAMMFLGFDAISVAARRRSLAWLGLAWQALQPELLTRNRRKRPPEWSLF